MDREIIKEADSKPLILFGRDVRRIPCFRDSFLYGISSGLGGLLTAFLFTSRGQLSCHIGMGTFVCVTLGYWTQCRYERLKDIQARAAIEASINEAAISGQFDESSDKPPLVDA
ncbi:cytochrome c oxidase protein 20 homolog [Orussus abietinus]|uniref:cytochrome c oxidase protein 20 homolog n=1 Tax=Orussus abietinus TaxID=222816 RepID=UPI0006269610|nr:cytochrome c oxidase protein 20 homolog [Orussus abietinus]